MTPEREQAMLEVCNRAARQGQMRFSTADVAELIEARRIAERALKLALQDYHSTHEQSVRDACRELYQEGKILRPLPISERKG